MQISEGQMISNNENKTELAISISDLKHQYNGVWALDNISFSLPLGATLAIIGPDGVGKSTLLSLLSGIKIIQNGSVQIFGKDLRRTDERLGIQQKIAFMPQGLGRKLYYSLSVYENVEYAARIYGIPNKERISKIDYLLEATGLINFHRRPAYNLSGGMKQKLALCCSLIQEPALLILDEPTTGVDPLSRLQFWELIDKIKIINKSMTIVNATSNMQEAERFDYIAALDWGRLLIFEKTKLLLRDKGADTIEEAYLSLLTKIRKNNFEKAKFKEEKIGRSIPVIQAINLTKYYGNFKAVEDVNFNIEKGEIFGFLGPNGCGKTTTIKMITGLLNPTSGRVSLFNNILISENMDDRLDVGYMSQGFSLYEEITVRQNLELHAKLYGLTVIESKRNIVDDSLIEFDLREVSGLHPKNLPLGIRQRLQLAVACLHKPKLLVLDEPTSGVDLVARELFWKHLYRLSRVENVTIFITTHFMNEADKCDRVTLMDRGKLLTTGTPTDVAKSRGFDNLDQTFISYLKENEKLTKQSFNELNDINSGFSKKLEHFFQCLPHPLDQVLSNVWTVAWRESVELLRDTRRLLFCLFGPVVLVIIASYCVSYDLRKINYSIVDRDQSQTSVELSEIFRGNPYLSERPIDWQKANNLSPINGVRELLVELPDNFSKDLDSGARPQVGVFIDGTTAPVARQASTLTEGILSQYIKNISASHYLAIHTNMLELQPVFLFNPEYKSINSVSPGALMLALLLYPTMMTALAIVREKEIGSISIFFSSPINVYEYLIGKQLPYIFLAQISFYLIFFIIRFCIGIKISGSFLGLTIGVFLYSFSTSAFGLLISTLVGTQVAAIFGAAITCLIIGVIFSGYLFPVSLLSGGFYYISMVFPAMWFQKISLGTLVKGVEIYELAQIYLIIVIIATSYLYLAGLMLRKQEA